MRTALLVLLVVVSGMVGCVVAAPSPGTLSGLGDLACSGYDQNNDGVTTAQEVKDVFQSLTGTAMPDAAVQEFLTMFCN